MLKNTQLISFILGVLLIVVGCDGQSGNLLTGSSSSKSLSTEPMLNRWYSEAQVAHGKTLFLTNCASCHQADASGTKDWKTVDANGKYPPPPLNGSAHTWHHSMDVLRRTIVNGGVALGGVMPGFKDVLNETEMDEIIAFFQSTWPEDVYTVWEKRDNKARNRHKTKS